MGLFDSEEGKRRLLVVEVPILERYNQERDPEYRVQARAGVIAVDGERELTFEAGELPVITLRTDGPRCVDVPAVLAASARLGLLTSIHHPREEHT